MTAWYVYYLSTCFITAFIFASFPEPTTLTSSHWLATHSLLCRPSPRNFAHSASPTPPTPDKFNSAVQPGHFCLDL
ncbi:hypothetical protein FA13DRAFT_1733069, partial [Coprinellus micaceus]